MREHEATNRKENYLRDTFGVCNEVFAPLSFNSHVFLYVYKMQAPNVLQEEILWTYV